MLGKMSLRILARVVFPLEEQPLMATMMAFLDVSAIIA